MRDLSSEDVVGALHRFGLERDRLRTAQARRLGIALADLDALEHLELPGRLTQRDLAVRLLLSSGAVTFLVDRLRAGRGWSAGSPIRRIGVPHWSRSPLGRSCLEVPELDRYHQSMRREAAQLSPTARSVVADFLSAVTAHAADATAELQRRKARQAK